jgi:glucoamylase
VGQSVPAATTHAGWTYREVFARDSYETFTGLLADGDTASARDMTVFLFDHAQQPDGSFPRDSELNGAVAPDTFGLSEIDEVAYPLLMAWQAGLAGKVSFYQNHIRPAADYIVDHGPITGAERWEEHPGFSPATIASEIAGLVAAGNLATAAGDTARADLYFATADDYQRNVKRWTVTTTGPDGPRYFIRESLYGNPNTARTYDLGNGSQSKVDQRSIIDAGFLELTRMGELSARDPDVQASLHVVDSVLKSQTASGPGWHRYGIKANGATDGYGDCYVPDPTSCHPTGKPWFTHSDGSGHLWPLLTGERAEQDLQSGRRAAATRLAVDFQRMTWGLGYVPEQVWENPDTPPSPFGANPTTASIGFRNGQAAGSAAPLIWGQAQYLRLVLDLKADTLVDQPEITRARYLNPEPPADVPVTIASPADGMTVTGPDTLVTGTTTPGARVNVAVGQPRSPANTARWWRPSPTHTAPTRPRSRPLPTMGERSSPPRPPPVLTPRAGRKCRSTADSGDVGVSAARTAKLRQLRRPFAVAVPRLRSFCFDHAGKASSSRHDAARAATVQQSPGSRRSRRYRLRPTAFPPRGRLAIRLWHEAARRPEASAGCNSPRQPPASICSGVGRQREW